MDLWSVEAFEKILDHKRGRSLSCNKESFQDWYNRSVHFFSKGVYFLKYHRSPLFIKCFFFSESCGFLLRSQKNHVFAESGKYMIIKGEVTDFFKGNVCEGKTFRLISNFSFSPISIEYIHRIYPSNISIEFHFLKLHTPVITAQASPLNFHHDHFFFNITW